MNCLQNPPQLQINKVLYHDRSMAAHVRLEQRIVWNLLLTLEEKGFTSHYVDDGDEQTPATSKKAAMELLFNLDDAYLFLRHKDGDKDTRGMHRTVWIRLVFGNGVDVVSDYNASNWKGFENVMDKFDAEVYA